ncbi:NPCBM/NEW2 domain-containing protein [Rhodococcoides fascians]|uniref:NPCBM/NEW2 domain-containing protein n=1 Tax=Rhodococcoides fascians TaxID=1828 RepID=UPI00050C4952|nr:NPCBM/NEW2 domain-containing protein [Rhodococcus fascians]
MNSGGTDHKLTKKQQIIIGIVVPLVVALIGAIALIYVNRDKHDNANGNPEPGTSSSHSAGPTTTPPTSTPTPSSSTTTPRPRPTTTTTGPRPAQKYLDELKALDGGGLRTGSAEVNGDVYPHSLYANIGGCRTSGRYAYNIGRDWTTFETTVGLRDDTESRTVAQFEILADDVPVYTSGNMSVGQSVPVSVSVDNVLQLKIGYVFVDGDMGLCSDAGNVVWGDPTLR